MGIVEGVTEFLPISSTGHLILVGDWIGYPEASRVTMEIFIQMGAILAVFWQYGAALRDLAARAPHDGAARDLVAKVLLAFVPAAVVGLLFHHAIEEHLFNPLSVASALVLGGILLIVIERRPRAVTIETVEATRWSDALWVGVAQVASLFPGVSRAGATIVGGLLVGMSRPAATDFSFYLALPTVSAASLFSLAKDIHLLDRGDVAPLAVGFVAAYVSALLVIRSFLRFVRSHDFQGFGWYRIVFGAIVLSAAPARAGDAAPQLGEVVVEAERPVSAASSFDFSARSFDLEPHDTPFQLLNDLPGVVVAQHQGGGKAPQYLVRGFDADHGTDFAVFLDGRPVNLPTHAHGQGYADTNVLIPETLDTVHLYKGPYLVQFGP